jgi:Zn-dependent M28 family amino/carboxypeptidase
MEGTDKKDEVVIITSHYDHIGKRSSGEGDLINNGADDDGSGTVAVMALAKAFTKAKADGKGPRRSILFMTVTGEEKGLLGSDYYSKNPIFPLANTVVDLNIDMIGRTDPGHEGKKPYVYVIGSDRLSSELHKISESTNETYTKLDFDYMYNAEDHPDRIYYRSDHWNFAKNDIPIIFYFDGIHADYHKPSDEVDKIEFDNLQLRAQVVFYTAWELANRDKRIEADLKK